MDGYVTGGRHGDGAVFALDLTEVRPRRCNSRETVLTSRV